MIQITGEPKIKGKLNKNIGVHALKIRKKSTTFRPSVHACVHVCMCVCVYANVHKNVFFAWLQCDTTNTQLSRGGDQAQVAYSNQQPARVKHQQSGGLTQMLRYFSLPMCEYSTTLFHSYRDTDIIRVCRRLARLESPVRTASCEYAANLYSVHVLYNFVLADKSTLLLQITKNSFFR